MDTTKLSITLPPNEENESIIKVLGVGGGGGNAVSHMYAQGIENVTFLVCNTDKAALAKSPVPQKLQLGPTGLGAGGKPERARELAEESIDEIREALSDGTRMLFITAGEGGGTGTGASPVVAKVAKEMDILTVGIVTIPFEFEGKRKIRKALRGVAELAENVDALLVINNQKLCRIFPDLDIPNAFAKSDDVLANAAKSIAEIITVTNYINTDFADVYNTLKNGGVAIMNVGQAGGEERITKAIRNALDSPLVNTADVHGASRVLIQFYCTEQHAIKMNEFDQIHQFMDEVGEDVEVQWGIGYDDTLGEDVKVTIIATGYKVSDIPGIEEVKLEFANEQAAENQQEIEQPRKPTIDEAAESFYGPEKSKKPEPEGPQTTDSKSTSPTANESLIDIFSSEPNTDGEDDIPGWMRAKR